MDKKKFNKLVRLLERGEEKALEPIYNEYSPKIKSVAISVMKDNRYLDDVVQAVMIKIYNDASIIRSVKFPDAFIYQMAKNISVDFYRRYYQDVMKEMNLEGIKQRENSIEEARERMEFHSMIDFLQDDEKEIIIMKLLFDYSFKQIADELEISESTAKWKYYNSLKKINEKIFLEKSN